MSERLSRYSTPNLLTWSQGVIKRADFMDAVSNVADQWLKKDNSQLDKVWGYPERVYDMMANQSMFESPKVREYADMGAKLLGAKGYDSLSPNQKKWMNLGLYAFVNNFGDSLGILNSGNLYANMHQAVLHNRRVSPTLKGFSSSPRSDADTLKQAYELTRIAQNQYYNNEGYVNQDLLGDMKPELYASYAAAVASKLPLDANGRIQGYTPQTITSGAKTITELSQIFGTSNYHDIKEMADATGFPDISDPKNNAAIRKHLDYIEQLSHNSGRTMRDVLSEQSILSETLKQVTGEKADPTVLRNLQRIGDEADVMYRTKGYGMTRAQAQAEAIQDMAGYSDARGTALAVARQELENPSSRLSPQQKQHLRSLINRVLATKDKYDRRAALSYVRGYVDDLGLLRDPYNMRRAASRYGLWVAGIRGQKPYYQNI